MFARYPRPTHVGARERMVIPQAIPAYMGYLEILDERGSVKVDENVL